MGCDGKNNDGPDGTVTVAVITAQHGDTINEIISTRQVLQGEELRFRPADESIFENVNLRVFLPATQSNPLVRVETFTNRHHFSR